MSGTAHPSQPAAAAGGRLTVLQREEAWYCMRGLRPTSPRTMTQARRGRAGGSKAEAPAIGTAAGAAAVAVK